MDTFPSMLFDLQPDKINFRTYSSLQRGRIDFSVECSLRRSFSGVEVVLVDVEMLLEDSASHARNLRTSTRGERIPIHGE